MKIRVLATIVFVLSCTPAHAWIVVTQMGGQWIQPANVPVASAPSDPEDTDETGRESETERGRADVELPDLRDASDDQDAE